MIIHKNKSIDKGFFVKKRLPLVLVLSGNLFIDLVGCNVMQSKSKLIRTTVQVDKNLIGNQKNIYYSREKELKNLIYKVCKLISKQTGSSNLTNTNKDKSLVKLLEIIQTEKYYIQRRPCFFIGKLKGNIFQYEMSKREKKLTELITVINHLLKINDELLNSEKTTSKLFIEELKKIDRQISTWYLCSKPCKENICNTYKMVCNQIRDLTSSIFSEDKTISQIKQTNEKKELLLAAEKSLQSYFINQNDLLFDNCKILSSIDSEAIIYHLEYIREIISLTENSKSLNGVGYDLLNNINYHLECIRLILPIKGNNVLLAQLKNIKKKFSECIGFKSKSITEQITEQKYDIKWFIEVNKEATQRLEWLKNAINNQKFSNTDSGYYESSF